MHICMCIYISVSKEFNNFTITYGLLRDPTFSSDQIQFDLEVCTYVCSYNNPQILSSYLDYLQYVCNILYIN